MKYRPVLDEPLDDPADKHPGGFEPIRTAARSRRRLIQKKRAAAVTQREQQTVDAPALTPGGIEPEPEQAEIHRGRFARWGIGHADADGWGAHV